MAIWSFAWRVYGACLNVEIQPNEGWNAYFVDAATGKMPLYPSADKLITNNYPALSFHIVGLIGRFIGDPVLAGRLLSLVAVVAVATAITLSVRRVGGGGVAAAISAAFSVAIMSRFFRQAQAIFLLAVCARLLASKHLHPLRPVFDRSFKNEIAMRDRAMTDTVQRVRRLPGDVLCSALVSYRAGKPIAIGTLPADAVAARLASGTLTIVEVDPLIRWPE